MRKYKIIRKNNRKLWYGWRKDSSNFFGVTTATIDYWYLHTKPKLMQWLQEELNKRKEEQEKAEIIKNNLIKV